MKAILRAILTNLLVIYMVDLLYPGFNIGHGIKTLLTASVVWYLLNKFIKPVIKLLLLPINLITLNLFAWAIGLITLFLLQYIVGHIEIVAYQFPGMTFSGFVVPPIYVNLLVSYILTSILLNGGHSFIKWLISKDEEK